MTYLPTRWPVGTLLCSGHVTWPESSTRVGRPVAKASELVMCFWGEALEGVLKGGVGNSLVSLNCPTINNSTFLNVFFDTSWVVNAVLLPYIRGSYFEVSPLQRVPVSCHRLPLKALFPRVFQECSPWTRTPCPVTASRSSSLTARRRALTVWQHDLRL